MAVNNNQLQSQLGAAHQLIQQGEHEVAIVQLLALIERATQHPDPPHLLALAYKAQNQVVEAERYFFRSLDLNQKQPQVHNNLGNLYQSETRFIEAEKHYRLALELQNGFVDAERNLALCLVSQKRFEEASDLYIKLITSHPNDASLRSGFGDCARLLSDYDKAIKQYKTALKLAPQHVNALHNLGLTYHLCGKLEDALKYYQAAYQLAPFKIEVVQSFANVIHELGNTRKAIELLAGTVQRIPGASALHERLNELLWENGGHNDFGKSYLAAIDLQPENIHLYISLGGQLFRAGKSQQALKIVNSAIEEFGEEHQLLELRGQVFADLGDSDSAKQDLTKALSIHFTKDGGHALTKLYILEKSYAQAQNVIEQLISLDADCQLSWALQSIVWRLTEDSRYHWLCDYSAFVRAYKIDPPKGYANLQQFIDALVPVLMSLHNAKGSPLQQTLRHGTQTAPRLLHQPIKEIQELKKCLASIVEQYISQLPEDLQHPLLSRKTPSFHFSGSWSVKLEPNGFHVNHVHPAGWISSSCYLVLPANTRSSEMTVDTKLKPDFPGAIKFGESPLQLGSLELIEKIIIPDVGTVVLFPSYMWHGTFPFFGQDTEFRLTAPFDVLPI